MLEQSCIPARFRGRSLDNFNAATPEQRGALTAARSFVENFEQHLRRGDTMVFMGMPGTGKSHLATAILQALMPKHCGMYTTCLGMIRAIRATWRKDSEKSENDVLQMLERVGPVHVAVVLARTEVFAHRGRQGVRQAFHRR